MIKMLKNTVKLKSKSGETIYIASKILMATGKSCDSPTPLLIVQALLKTFRIYVQQKANILCNTQILKYKEVNR
uniref:Uncharacterized protein n=1 Tax=Arundo donax TaxID=35708 RepID=A0A0A9FB15_ARUDO